MTYLPFPELGYNDTKSACTIKPRLQSFIPDTLSALTMSDFVWIVTQGGGGDPYMDDNGNVVTDLKGPSRYPSAPPTQGSAASRLRARRGLPGAGARGKLHKKKKRLTTYLSTYNNAILAWR